jgi:protein-S-isoprenylcysteine O-methyltransferase Ste14
MTEGENMWEKQGWHAFWLLLLLTLVATIVHSWHLQCEFGGWPLYTWFIVTLATPVLHQFYVWFCWRAELHFRFISRALGYPRGFLWYSAGFAILGLARFVTLLGLGLADYGSLPLAPAVSSVIGLILFVPAFLLFHSVHYYFGFLRAFGRDHFDKASRTQPLVRRGMFRLSPNAMYVFGFLVFWAMAFLLSSKAALLAAGFNHAYIWVHYFTTERPDMRRIYPAQRISPAT